MCGIAGIISASSTQYDKQDVQKMISCLSHRGPDDEAIWQNKDGNVILGHRRLAIIDRSSAAAQPMHYLDRYTIIHNGEIYNYKELKEQLSARGYNFRSQSDTEVILASYDCWKEECLQHFDGMFAFAIWDEQEKTLFAARDRFGEKPFYHNYDGNTFCFASEIKAFRQIGLSKSYNGNFLLQYFANGFTQDATDPSATFDQHIKKLPVRHYLKFSAPNSVLSITPYYDLDKTSHHIPAEEAIEKFRSLFFTSVSRRLRSDAEVGTSLSGGLDSSSVVAAIHHLKQTGTVQKAFTASFPGFKKDETNFASLVAIQFSLQHFITSPTSAELVTDLEKFLAQHDEPVSSASVYAQYKVYELAKKHGVKVVLDGQGADEVLAGYSKYIHWYLQELYASGKTELLKKEMLAFQQNDSVFVFNFKNKLAAKLPGWAAIQLEKKATKAQKQHPHLSPDFINEYLEKHSIQKPIVKSLNDILYFDVFGGNLEELLRYADRNAMAHGVEVRLPFLNHELVEFAFSLPSTFKFHNGYSKYTLRQSMDDLLPKEITWRKDKVGFEPPQQQWMQDKQLQEKIHEAKMKLVQEKILKPSALSKLIQPKAAHEANNFDWRYLSAAASIF
jgi:asparagine synthase (glutamine-hydrolysing)